MADLVKIYEDMVAKLEVQRDRAKSQAVRAGIEGLLQGALTNLANAKAE